MGAVNREIDSLFDSSTPPVSPTLASYYLYSDIKVVQYKSYLILFLRQLSASYLPCSATTLADLRDDLRLEMRERRASRFSASRCATSFL